MSNIMREYGQLPANTKLCLGVFLSLFQLWTGEVYRNYNALFYPISPTAQSGMYGFVANADAKNPNSAISRWFQAVQRKRLNGVDEAEAVLLGTEGKYTYIKNDDIRRLYAIMDDIIENEMKPLCINKDVGFFVQMLDDVIAISPISDDTQLTIRNENFGPTYNEIKQRREPWTYICWLFLYSIFNRINDQEDAAKQIKTNGKAILTAYQRPADKFIESMTVKPISSYIPRLNEDSILDTISDNFKQPQNKIFVISGLSGLGKSELARHFSEHRWRNKPVLEINLPEYTDKKYDLREAIRDLPFIDLPVDSNDDDKFNLFSYWLRDTTTADHLLIIHNLNNIDCELIRFFQRKEVKAHILFTSQCTQEQLMNDMYIAETNILQLEEDEKYAADVFKNIYSKTKIQINEDIIHNLVKALSSNTLMVSYIAKALAERKESGEAIKYRLKEATSTENFQKYFNLKTIVDNEHIAPPRLTPAQVFLHLLYKIYPELERFALPDEQLDTPTRLQKHMLTVLSWKPNTPFVAREVCRLLGDLPSHFQGWTDCQKAQEAKETLQQHHIIMCKTQYHPQFEQEEDMIFIHPLFAKILNSAGLLSKRDRGFWLHLYKNAIVSTSIRLEANVWQSAYVLPTQDFVFMDIFSTFMGSYVGSKTGLSVNEDTQYPIWNNLTVIPYDSQLLHGICICKQGLIFIYGNDPEDMYVELNAAHQLLPEIRYGEDTKSDVSQDIEPLECTILSIDTPFWWFEKQHDLFRNDKCINCDKRTYLCSMCDLKSISIWKELNKLINRKSICINGLSNKLEIKTMLIHFTIWNYLGSYGPSIELPAIDDVRIYFAFPDTYDDATLDYSIYYSFILSNDKSGQITFQQGTKKIHAHLEKYRSLILPPSVEEINIDDWCSVEKVIVDKKNTNFIQREDGTVFTADGKKLIFLPPHLRS